MSKGAVLDLAHLYFPAARESFAQAQALDWWGKGRQSQFDGGKLFIPNRAQAATDEYTDLGERSYTPWLPLVVTALVQTMFTESIRTGDSKTDEILDVWKAWKRNGWDAKQISLYRDCFTHGIAYGVSLPGRDALTGETMPVLRAVSARRMDAFYAEENDEYPFFTIEAERYVSPDGRKVGWNVSVMDEECVYRITCEGDGEDRKNWFFIDYLVHGTGVTPVSRYVNMIDLDGNATSEVEPLIPIAKRIDQTEFDRLIVQRYGAWKIRYITGLVKPNGVSDESHVQNMLKMKISDFLIAEGKDTKFGTLPETQLDGFIAARDADIRDLAAVSQTPPHHMLGLSSNMQPESLAAVNANLANKSFERKTGTGLSHVRLMRVAAKQMGNTREAGAYDMHVKWKDTETRSFAQAAQALGVLATQLQVPVEMLWRRIPDWTDFDSREAKELVTSGAFEQLLQGLASQSGGTDPSQASQTVPGVSGAQP